MTISKHQNTYIKKWSFFQKYQWENNVEPNHSEQMQRRELEEQQGEKEGEGERRGAEQKLLLAELLPIEAIGQSHL